MVDWAGSTDLGLNNVEGQLITGAVVYNATGSFSWAEGCAQSALGPGLSVPGLGYFIGSRGAFEDRYFKGALSALLVWPRPLNDSERGAAEAYLAAKYPRPQAQPPLSCRGLPTNCSLSPPLAKASAHLASFVEGMRSVGYADGKYELAHALVGGGAVVAWGERCAGLLNGTIPSLGSAAAEQAADALYRSTAENLYDGLGAVIGGYAGSADAEKARIYAIWENATIRGVIRQE